MKKRFWAPEFKPQAERKLTRWCPKCMTWAKKFGKSGKPAKHRCDFNYAPKTRLCKSCGKQVRLTVKYHACDDPPPLKNIPEDLEQRQCLWCREWWPLHPTYFYCYQGKFLATCQACRAHRRKMLKAGPKGAKRRKPGPKRKGWYPDNQLGRAGMGWKK